MQAELSIFYRMWVFFSPPETIKSTAAQGTPRAGSAEKGAGMLKLIEEAKFVVVNFSGFTTNRLQSS